MQTNKMIVFVLTVGVVAAIPLFNRVAHSYPGNSSLAISQTRGTTPPAGGSVNSSNTEAATTPATAPEQPPAPSAASQAPTDEHPTAAASDSTIATAAASGSTIATAAASGPTIAAAPANRPAVATTVPEPIVVPLGTTLIVRLAEQLGSSISEEGQSFSAVLDRDVVVNGQMVIAAGTGVTGKVTLASPVGPLAGEAHLQLKLTSLYVNNADLAVVTSTRSFGAKIKGKNKVGRFVRGLVKRAVGEEREVILDDQSAYSFTLGQPLQIQ
jgi:hypothetical protein